MFIRNSFFGNPSLQRRGGEKVFRDILTLPSPCGGAFLVGTLKTLTACAGNVGLVEVS
jgi:hypothetical protein